MHNSMLLLQKPNIIYHSHVIQFMFKYNSYSHATFLDLDISIEDKVIRTKTYDKRDDFKFEIINYPHLSSNIPTAYGVIISESLRHFRNSTNEGDAIEKIKTLVNKLIQKECKLPVIRSTIKKTLERHQWIQKKYNCNSEYLYRKLTI